MLLILFVISRTSGAIWSKNISSSSNTFYQVRIRQGGDTQLFFSHLLPPPANNIACVSFRYRKHSTGRKFYKDVMITCIDNRWS